MTTQRKSFPGSWNSKCKGPEAGTCLVCLQNSEVNSMFGMASRGCVVAGNEIRDVMGSQTMLGLLCNNDFSF